MRLQHVALALMACTRAPNESPLVIVRKLDGYERHMMLDEAGRAAFARSAVPTSYIVTMETFTHDAPGSIFVRELRDGAWWSSSPSPGTFVYGEPRIEPGCDDCHAQFADPPGMFVFFAAREAVARGATAVIECAAAGTDPCIAATYRELQWLE
jgi:hypothetical protein